MTIHEDLIQGSVEWIQAKLGKPSASNWKRVANSYNEPEYYVDNAANKKADRVGKLKNNPGFQEGAITYSLELIAEILTELPTFVPESYDMEVGKEREPIAREIYENSRKVVVKQVGGIEENGLWVSPDGLIGDDGTIEIKCFARKQHLRVLLSGEVPEENMDQIQDGFMISGRKWCDFIVFNPDFINDSLKSKVIRVYPDKEYITKNLILAEKFKQLIKDTLVKLGVN